MEQNQIIDKNKQLEKDIRYIQEDVIAYQKNGLICKVCKPLKCLTVTNLSKEKYIKYWSDRYKGKQDVQSGRYDKIVKVCQEKLKSGMTDLDKVIKIEMESKDLDSEKEKLIQEITTEIENLFVEEDEDDI